MSVIKQIGKSALRCIGPTFIEEPFRWFASRRSTLSRFRDLHRGKRCFVIGNGPSLNKIDLTRLNNEHTFAVNGIFYKTDECGFRPQYYVVEDYHVIRDNMDRIRAYSPRSEGATFLPARFRHCFLGGRNRYFLNLNRAFYDEQSPYYEVPRFSVDMPRNVYVGQSVTIVNLQLAYYMGFSTVYLIGMDFNYHIPSSAKINGNVIESTEDDVNHFNPAYFGAGKKWHDPKLNNVLKSYMLCKLMFEMAGRKIVNATIGGKLELFPRESFDEVMGGCA